MQLAVRCLLLAMLLMLAVVAAPLTFTAVAQVTGDAPAKVVIDKRKLLVPPRNPDGSFIETPFTEDPIRWMRDKQQNFYRQMSGALRGVASRSPGKAAWTLVLLSFLYGVFHAAGPGHGKAVISGWVLATENELRRGIIIAAMSALFQALTAIVIVGGLLLFVHSAAAMARDVAGFLESASYLMIAGLGLYLVWSGLPSRVAGQVATAPSFEIVNPLHGPLPAHHHAHDENCGCGHGHAPQAADVKGDWSWTRAVALAFAVGLRPCTGALLVLMFSWSIGIFWAGIVSTLAMAVGVFITIAAIASLAVYGKALALRFAGLDNRLLGQTVAALRVACGAGIAALGGLMFWASLGTGNGMT